MRQLSTAQARRVALAAQGFLDPPHAVPTLRTFGRTLERTGVLQVDSVNVLQRASSGRERRRMVEYWAHVQAFMPVELWPVMRHRMDSYREQLGKWGIRASPQLVPELLAAIRGGGAATARQLDALSGGGPRRREHWGWNWSEARKVLDYLFMTGQLAVAGRNSQFEVIYDLPERVLPAAVLAAATPPLEGAHRELVRRAARSCGVATVRCLSDYYRMPAAATERAAADLVDSGELERVSVQGWRRPAFLHTEARHPRRVAARALLSPFDPVVWQRDRTERLFNFHYRIEIYVPPPQRVYGYYVLPFLLGERLVARVDLKADRPGRRLVVKGAFAEQPAPVETAEELSTELRRLAGWLGLDDVVVEPRGDLAASLRP